MNRSMWSMLRSPWYLVSAAPWAALISMVIQPSVFFFGLFFFWFSVSLASTVNPIQYPTGFIIEMLLMVILCGGFLPILGLWFSYVERGRLWVLGFRDIPSAHVALPLRPVKVWFVTRYREPASWRNVLAMAASTMFGIATMVVFLFEGMFLGVTAFLWAVTGGLHRSLSASDLESIPIRVSWLTKGHLAADDWWMAALTFLGFLLLFAYFNGLYAAITGTVSKLLLSPRPEEIERQVHQLTSSRARILDNFESERRRIERDLHDGVQQELVNLNLRLGLAEFELQMLEGQGVDASAAREQVVRAQEQMNHALQTLRNTVRGIYPAVLEDHGLKAALEELANNCMLPVHLHYTAAEQLPNDVQRTAYYLANEAVTNALKHSTANALWINASVEGSALLVEVTDNGQGGADMSRGTGISGLNERVQPLGGEVWVDSPVGGPTTLSGRLPLRADASANNPAPADA
ncbi:MULTISPECIES: sensor histidine kinase [Micrococcales]|uniref:sensor histidine kinase n=1 Tax=Micrococcales TaxID=85006 RepID=UPI00068F59E0|nr:MULTISPECIES: sensor histidine kinase [Micrococcales]